MSMPDVDAFARAARVRRVGMAVAPLTAATGIALMLRQAAVPVEIVAILGVIVLLVGMLTMRWPWVGFSIAIFGTALLEPLPLDGDPTTVYTWIFHANFSSWTFLGIAFSIVETLLILTAVSLCLKEGFMRRWWPPRGSLDRPILVFGALVIAGFGYGVALNGGDMRIALWEVRALAYLVACYFLAGALVRSTRHVRLLTWLLLVGLALNGLRLTVRFLIFYGGVAPEGNASISGGAHENALFMVVLILLCLAQLSFGRGGWQRGLLLVSMPTAIIGLLASQRRVSFVVLILGLIIWALFLFLQRRAMFWIMVPPMLLVAALYLGVFWNRADGMLGQPVRAVRTITGQEVSERDKSSDLYRQQEEYNIWRTLRESPITGIGFGKPFNIYVSMATLGGWEFQYYTPHNQVFWLWLKLGAAGFVATLWLFASAIAHTIRAMKHINADGCKPFILMTATYTVMLLTFSYVDIGLASGRAMLLLGSLLGVIAVLPRVVGQEAAEREHGLPTPFVNPWAPQAEPAYSQEGRS
jgi:O-antigen ligase